MRRHNPTKLEIFFGILTILVFSFEILSQPSPPEQDSSEGQPAWMGPISPQEKRIKDLKSDLSDDTPKLPESFHLFFQEFQGDYAVFYDLDGHIIQFRYRRNKWDEENTRKYHFLMSGRSYRLAGKFLGILYYPKNQEDKRLATRVFLPSNPSLDWQLIQEISSIPVYELTSCVESYSDSIIFQSMSN